MPEKLPALKPKKLIRFLCNRKGFIVERISGSHYQLKHPATGRRVTIPMHRTELRRGTLKEIMAAAGIGRDGLGGI